MTLCTWLRALAHEQASLTRQAIIMAEMAWAIAADAWAVKR